jgi:eukaryotic-like serine/threonine-protein kinase
VHRDVKPANVLFDAAGSAHLADFGIATARDVTAGLTHLATAIGTPGFLAPEQARGEAAGPAADVFSLGATLRWAVTGTGPYGEGPPDVLLWRASRDKVDRCPRTVPSGLRRRIDAMLEVRPERRPTAAALAGGPTGTDERPTAHRGAGRARRRRRILSVIGLATAVAVAAIGLYLLARPSDDPAATPRPTGSPTSTSTEPTTTTTACVPLPYQPCGAPDPAPGTDGQACLAGFADYDADAANGCEAVADTLDGAPLDDMLAPTIVPADDVDEFPVEVGDDFQLLCDGTVTFRITSPPGMVVRLVVLAENGDELGTQTSVEGTPGELRISEPSCFGDDAQTLTARVTPVGSDRSAEPYRLERRGSF